jgi:AraC-like DNA-binding protein
LQLKTITWPLKTVAGMCGFENQRYFSTCFRRMTGTTPGAFRRAVAGRRP